uniref:hypothetical protein n=1 Tax=Flavobacterium sp. TaxID=239 RepID=UPI004049E5C7
MKSIQLIGDLICSYTDVSFVLDKQYTLRKATKRELFFITRDIQESFGNDIFSKNFNPYLNEFDTNKNIKKLDFLEHRCWVIERKNGHFGAFDLGFLGLSKLSLTILCCYIYEDEIEEGLTEASITKIYPSHYTFTVFYANLKQLGYPTKNIATSDIADIKRTLDIVGDFKKVKSKYPIVSKAFQDFIKLAEIPESNPFKILSYFSILEYVLTTNNPNTSITHQLATKIMLLNKRLQEEICISKFFKVNPNLDTLIKKLYDLRSQIAHGSFSGFETFKIETKYPLKQAIPDFIYQELLTKIIIQSLIEPELIEDLRKC